jgi:hypothetical protein
MPPRGPALLRVCRRCYRAHPPTGPCLFEYGDSFPIFLAAFPPCRDLVPARRGAARLGDECRAPRPDVDDGSASFRRWRPDMPRLIHRRSLGIVSRVPLASRRQIWRQSGRGGAPSDPIDLASGGDVRLEVRRAGNVATMRALAPPIAADALPAAPPRSARPICTPRAAGSGRSCSSTAVRSGDPSAKPCLPPSSITLELPIREALVDRALPAAAAKTP